MIICVYRHYVALVELKRFEKGKRSGVVGFWDKGKESISFDFVGFGERKPSMDFHNFLLLAKQL